MRNHSTKRRPRAGATQDLGNESSAGENPCAINVGSTIAVGPALFRSWSALGNVSDLKNFRMLEMRFLPGFAPPSNVMRTAYPERNTDGSRPETSSAMDWEGFEADYERIALGLEMGSVREILMSERNDSSKDWLAECERAAFAVATLLRLADRRAASSAVIEILRAAPHSPSELAAPSESPFMRCALAAVHLAQSWERGLLDQMTDYFMSLAQMEPERRAMLEASVVGTLTGLGMGG